jgi:hypothetical protein
VSSGVFNVNGIVRAGNGVKFADGSVQTTAVSGGAGLTLPASLAASTASGAFTVTQNNSTVLTGDPTFLQATTAIPGAIVGVAGNTSNTAAGVIAFSKSPDSPALVAWNGSTTVSASGEGSQGIIGQTENPNGTAIEATARSATGNTTGIKAKVNSPTGIALKASNPNTGGVAAEFDGNVVVNGTLQMNGPISSQGQLQISGPLVAGSVTVTGAPPITNSAGNLRINGNLEVGGNISKTSGTFKIDHPLDPAHKFLYHSFVESPDMMNIYNGVIVLNGKGEAWVAMPDWFEALNMDFRYQLTAMGAPGPNLYIAKEFAGGRFKIAGGKPNSKVSWQVTGIRQDAYAKAHRIKVEEEKPAAEQGTYLHPELFTPAADSLAQAQPRK